MKKLTVAAVVLVITAVMFCLNSCEDEGVKLVLSNSENDEANEAFDVEEGEKLVLCYSENDEVIRTFDVEEGTEFSVEFIHSVNKSPVKDVFVIRDGKIFADRTVYSSFGAGVQTELGEGQTLGYDENGNMVVSGFNMEFPKVECIVGTVYDHILEIGGESISLTELCGKNAFVYFELR